MAEQRAEAIEPNHETGGQPTEDDSSARLQQNRWDTLLLAATGEINARDSPLLRLPGELRTKIYGYVLGHMHIYPNSPQQHRGPSEYPPLLVCDCDGARDLKDHGRNTACWPQRLYFQLLVTCRQIYTEAFPVFWSTNIFCFEYSDIMSLVFQNLLPHQKALIKHVRLDIMWFVMNHQWKQNLKAANLSSLQSLQKIDIVTHTDKIFGPMKARVQRRRSRLVKSIFKMLAYRPFLTIVVTRNGRVYRRLGHGSRLGKLLERV